MFLTFFWFTHKKITCNNCIHNKLNMMSKKNCRSRYSYMMRTNVKENDNKPLKTNAS